ncbi:MAG: molybdenum cofactor biosynthesis protein MoaB [Gemmatimonadetes bacterium]|nr:molybdenum cofactor biosynthesis protein MoaB [Gemmatimonadota bacterium]MYB61815.1 molybdenum cofactor biosynthesis protein MoaB [Gemmatimonadota bacterium]
MSSKSTSSHKSQAAELGPLAVAVVTVSDSRTPETDVNGKYLRTRIEEAGHRVAGYHLIQDEPDQVESALEASTGDDVQIVIFNGGTGISKRDRTFDVLNRRLEKPLTGFGELFRMLSYEQVGAASMLSRATAGVYRNTVVISTPGSPAAVELAWEKLIAPEIAHLGWELTR